MSDDRGTPSGGAVVCAVCSCTLLPMSYALSLVDDPSGVDYRPHLKCIGCGQQYQWQDSTGWVPSYSIQRPALLSRQA